MKRARNPLPPVNLYQIGRLEWWMVGMAVLTKTGSTAETRQSRLVLRARTQSADRPLEDWLRTEGALPD